MRHGTRGLPAVAIVLISSAAAAGAAPAPQDVFVTPQSPAQLIDRIEEAWRARDAAAYLRLWEFAGPEARDEEARFVSERFAGEEAVLEIQRPLGEGESLEASAQALTVNEPRGRVESWLLRLERRPDGWAVTERRSLAGIEGLLHLSLDPQPFRADGLTLRLEDLELRMQRGTLFTSPPSLGPTVLVFVGEATVAVRPRPAAEQEQLRQFCGQTELVDRVREAFIRIHPADLHRVLSPARFDPYPQGSRDLSDARRFYREHAESSFVLDASLPRSPWWLLPSLGDASVTFRTARRGTLTFTMSSSEPEAISLFDRAKRLQICLYPREGRDTLYSEDEARSVDVLEHDLNVRFEPVRYALEGEDTLRLRLRAASATIQLKLDEGLQVRSITSPEGGEHLFFRVRHQDRVMVSLGPLAGTVGEVQLTVRYGGIHRPPPVEREVVQVRREPDVLPVEEDVIVEEILVYSNRAAWYPQAGGDDYAVSRLRFDVPQGYVAVTGGTLVSSRVERGRTRMEYRQDRPSKYISVAVGRLGEVGSLQEGSLRLEALSVGRTRAAASKLLGQAMEILRFYEGEFGPCPYPSLRLVVVEGRNPGGHSPPGMIVLSQRSILLRRLLRDDPVGFTDVPGYFLAHELAHQWWGHGVAGKNYRERWLSEGLAQYASVLWIRRSLGEERFQDVLGRMGRWAFKATDKGPIHLGYRLGQIRGDTQIFRAVVYDKAACVLHMLRLIAGEEAFRTGLRDFQARYRFEKAGSDDLRQALEAASGKDLSPYFQEWIFGTALPHLEVTHRAEAASPLYRTIVEVRAANLPGPVPLAVSVSYGGGRESRRVNLEPPGGRWVFETPAPARKVEVNADRGLLALVSER